eukprot:COSAG02_NODE_283_length_25709_cov_24.523311_17_plen_725_part_00
MRPTSAAGTRSRSAVSAMRARCALDSAREQAAQRAESSRKKDARRASPLPSEVHDTLKRRIGAGSGESSRPSARHTPGGAAGSSAEVDETTRVLLARWESAGRLLRRLPATAAGLDDSGSGSGGGSSSSESDDEHLEPAIGWRAPSVLAFDAAGSSVAVLDGAEVRLYKWLPKLQLWLQRGAISGTGSIQPQGLAALEGSELAITDAHRHVVVVFDSDGHEKRTIGRGLTRGSLVCPTALAADASGTTLAVFDRKPARIQLHRASTGALLRTLALEALGVTSVPVGGMAFDGCGHILVCDQAGQRVLRLRIFDGSCSATLSSDQLSCPGAVAALHDGTAIVGNGNTLQVFRPDGHWLCSVAVGRGGTASSHSDVAAVAIDASGHLFVSQQQVRPSTTTACYDGDGNLLVLSGPALAVPAQKIATAVPGPKELPPSEAGLRSKSQQQLRRRRRVALLLKEQLLAAVVERKLTIRGLFSVAGSDGGGRKLKNDGTKAPSTEQRVEYPQLAAALRRLGLNASKEEVCELMSLLALPAGNAEDEHVRSEDAFNLAITMEVPAARFVSFKQLEQLKSARMPGSASPARNVATTPQSRREKQPKRHGAPASEEADTTDGLDDETALRALRTLVALSPSQENEKRHWEFYDNQVAAAKAAQRPTPNPPSALLGETRNHTRGKLSGCQKSSPDLLSAYHAAALCAESPQVDLASAARDSLLALSSDTSLDDV